MYVCEFTLMCDIRVYVSYCDYYCCSYHYWMWQSCTMWFKPLLAVLAKSRLLCCLSD